MERLRFLLPAALAFGLGCQEAPLAPTARAVATPSFSATTSTDNFTIPVQLVAFVPCANGGAGEFVVVSGPLHVLLHITESDASNFHSKVHFQPQGLSGVGLDTGDKYQATGVTQEEFNVNGVLPITDTFINNFRMIGQGPGNNFMVHENFHITINANGELTAFVDNFNITCK